MSDLGSLYIDQVNHVKLHVLGVKSATIVKTDNKNNILYTLANESPSTNSDVMVFNANGEGSFISSSSFMPENTMINTNPNLTNSYGALIFSDGESSTTCSTSQTVIAGLSKLQLKNGSIIFQIYNNGVHGIFSGASAYDFDEYVYIGGNFVQTSERGLTINRPTTITIGRQYFDLDLGLPIYWNGTNWINAMGFIV